MKSFYYLNVALLALGIGACGGGGNSGSSTPPVNLTAVEPLFPINGSNWNSYVQGSTINTATDIACDPVNDTACLHGGELRTVTVDGRTSCTGLSANDALGAFNWKCDTSTGAVRFVSTGLAAGRNLSDLIDFTALGWKQNVVTIYDNGAPVGSTPEGTWWSNPVVAAPAAGGSLDSAGTVYVVAGDITLTTGYTLDASSAALVVQPGATITGPGLGNGSRIINGATQNFLWIEGAIRASDDDYNISLSNVRFSRLQNVRSYTSSVAGIYLNGSAHNTLVNLTSTNNYTYGVMLMASSNNTLVDVVANNNGYGLSLESSSNDNTLTGITVTNNGGNSLYLGNYSLGNTFEAVTSANNSGGVNLTNADKTTLAGVAATNNNDAVTLINSSTINLSDVAADNNHGYGFYLYNSSNNYFTGLLQIGYNNGDCYETGGSNPGITNTSCAQQGSSDFGTPVTGITLASAFIGKLISDDPLNTSDLSGVASYPTTPASFDWTDFSNHFRAWGVDGGDFPSLNNLGRWTTGTGRIWDWSLRASDTSIRNVLTLPGGTDTITHTWSDGTTITFLRHAVEVANDGVGNDNTLCESGETCLFTQILAATKGRAN